MSHARIVHMSNHNWPVICFLKGRLGKCRHALWQNGPKIDPQKFYWKCNRNLLKCKQNIYWYMYIIINILVHCSFRVNHWRYPECLNIWTLSKNLGARNDKPRFVIFLLQELCKLGNHNWPVILFLKLG